ncbi:cisplatin damage response ATP-dependent DNA ligase [Glaciecola sp. SC05]|uniref:cisplatin damage response ATP-dependent DNA ligase n=1 Tax=Glaciecola sp. SC05 TaxID=1987355 RepID=UPI0035299C02
MESFAELVDKLYFTSSNLAKSALIKAYLSNTKDPDRGWAIAAIAGTLNFDFFKRKLIKDLIEERVDPLLFALSYDYVGEMSETVSHLWVSENDDPPALATLPNLHSVIERFAEGSRSENRTFLISLLNSMSASQRWALLKLGTRGLRIGVSVRFLKKVLAEYGQQFNPDICVEDIERLWHGLSPPYQSLLSWLEGKTEIPDVSDSVTFQPVMLSHPFDENEIEAITPELWQAEWKYDGIRVQLVVTKAGKALFSRTGDDISASFPEILEALDIEHIHGIFDGELIALNPVQNEDLSTFSKPSIPFQGILDVKNDTQQWHIGSFNQLQQRLNKKKPSKKLIAEFPAGIILYDALLLNNVDLRDKSLEKRSNALQSWFSAQPYAHLHLSVALRFSNTEQLRKLREQAAGLEQGYIEGLMLKRKTSQYHSGRPKGKWYKWKRNPKLIDAVMMYAQRGHGKRSSFYSDYTFGCWQGDLLLPVGKAYSGFTDIELKRLDNWIRKNTMARFGPVKEVHKALVLEIAFDSVHVSKRHKSGVAMRFPRVHRIRWDKPASEANQLSDLKDLIQ